MSIFYSTDSPDEEPRAPNLQAFDVDHVSNPLLLIQNNYGIIAGF